MRSLNNSQAPSVDQILIVCRHVFRNTEERHSEGAVIQYLSLVAANDFRCPDLCDQWAVDFYNEHEAEITEDFFEVRCGS